MEARELFATQVLGSEEGNYIASANLRWIQKISANEYEIFKVREVLPNEKSYADGIAEGRRLERERIVGMLRGGPLNDGMNYKDGNENADWIENEGAKE